LEVFISAPHMGGFMKNFSSYDFSILRNVSDHLTMSPFRIDWTFNVSHDFFKSVITARAME
jgi:hypothetical protein